ncbi:acyl-CoA thioesterase [Cardiobacterium valvarum]|uniref:Acyl-CoA thioesterase YbgC n=1 Tax=Cardiobacterium valvarum TaxID=194702 RepID=A0A381EBJ3_9GAMM|nr:thioesterase family protein [Cardiobacterium valvarum]SUX24384.1 acyl-CoA thioesterase YbgC [Cardiobacterium valvarum]
MTTPFTADHTSRLTVRIGDINYGGHLGHDRLITLLHQARIELLHALGATETDCFGAGLIMRHLTCDYRGEAFLNDTLDIAMRVDNLRNAAYTLQYSVTSGDRPIAAAAAEMVAYDYQRHKIIALPPAFADALHRRRENHHDQ